MIPTDPRRDSAHRLGVATGAGGRGDLPLADGHVLTLSCDDRPGLVADVTRTLFEAGGNILEAQQFDDRSSGRFFMRIAFALSAAQVPAFRTGMVPLAATHGMRWRLSRVDRRQRVLLMVSRFDHCLADLLYRTRIGELPMEIVGIVTNHTAATLDDVPTGDIPIHALPIEPGGKPAQEAAVRRLIEAERVDLVVLARYMQILSDQMSAYLAGRCINIHHSFLPGFKGAKPYHQAHARGVKMIGATAHYVTADLDEGPIIAQDVATVGHADSPEDLIRKGRNIECRVLAQAVRVHLQDRVLLNGCRTVVFDT